MALSHPFRVGGVACHVLQDGELVAPASMTVANASGPEVDAELQRLGVGPDGTVSYPLNALLARTPHGAVLVDAGTGGAVPGTGHLLDALRETGTSPDDVAAVVVTHAHFDHLGGLLTGGRPTFPRARVVLARPEHEFWAAHPTLEELAVPDALRVPLRAVPDAVLPAVADRLDLLAFDDEVVPGVRLREAVGHTPGHTVVEITSGAETLVCLGDAVTLAMQLRHPGWLGPVENQPERSVPTRRRLLDRAVAERQLLFAAHLPFPGLGRVTAAEGDTYAWEPAA